MTDIPADESAFGGLLASALLRLHFKLQELDTSVDDSWFTWLAQRSAPMARQADPRLDNRVIAALLIRGPLTPPSRGRLADAELSIALLGRTELLRCLCALALARRPGVLRCCIERSARDALHNAVGDLLEQLVSSGHRGRPVTADAAGWSPLQWACVGYFDWLSLTGAADRIYRRLVRLALPMRLLGMGPRRRHVPADRCTRQALRLLMDAGAAWPC